MPPGGIFGVDIFPGEIFLVSIPKIDIIIVNKII
jgi:hypothetical protein